MLETLDVTKMKDTRKLTIIDNEDYSIGMTETGSLFFRVNGACLFLPKEEFIALKKFLCNLNKTENEK